MLEATCSVNEPNTVNAQVPIELRFQNTSKEITQFDAPIEQHGEHQAQNSQKLSILWRKNLLELKGKDAAMARYADCHEQEMAASRREQERLIDFQTIRVS